MKNLINKQWIQPAFVLIPLIISAIYCFTNSGFALATVVISLFLLVGFLPVCKKRENLWMFVFSGISLFPANISTAFFAAQWLEDELYTDSLFLKIIIVLIAIHILFCIEQVVWGILTRLIWRRQHKVEVE